MKKVMNLVLGGIENKIFNVFLFTLILVTGAFTAVIGVQSRNLTRVTEETSLRQKESIEQISGRTMQQVIEGTLGNDVNMKAAVADNIFHDLKSRVEFLAGYTAELYADAGSYSARKVDFPDPSRKGQICTQLLTEEGVDIGEEETAAEIGLLGNLSGTLEALYADANVNSFFIATERGTMVYVDDRPEEKFDENGDLIPIPMRQRGWYTDTMKEGKTFFSDVQSDTFTGRTGIVCAAPVYVDGRIAAIAGADLFLDDLAESVDSSGSEGSFVAVVNQQGHVIFSPEKDGIFQVRTADAAEDLRESEYEELGQFVKEALGGTADVRVIHLGEEEKYAAGASLDTVGWAVISVVDKEYTQQSMREMEKQYDTILADASDEYRSALSRSTWTILLLLLLIFVTGTVSVLIMAKRIVRPLGIMTRRIAGLTGKTPQFFMEDVYRTDDEIEVLAEAFASLSARTVQYVDEVKKITAEKERIGAELSMATAIQASQLPSIFPAFPERSEFDIYATMKPAKEVGGDFYDFFLVDDDHIAMVMADVSGKGVPAALFMMIAKILIKNRVLSGDSPAMALSRVNNQLTEGNEVEMFVTVWLGILEISTGKGIAANAGHEHPVIRRAGGGYELITYRHSPAVGAISGIRFREHTFELHPGDSLFVYTDGVAEATSSEEELFGTDRMLQALNREPDAAPEKVLRNVMKGIQAFVKDAVQFDDITMLCMKYYGPQNNKEIVMKELVLEAKTENLQQVLDFIDGQLEERGCSMKHQMQIDVAVEEIFVNIASYAYAPGSGDVTIRTEIQEEPRSIKVTFSDRGMPYNPLEKLDPDITLSAEERQIGGLGIFMVKKSVDVMEYTYKYGQNILTIRKDF